MKGGWILFLARRYFRTKRRNRGLAPSILSVTGIAVGVLTLISVLGVMNGFQLGFINDILAISSYDLRVSLPNGTLTDAQLARMRSLPGIDTVLPFRDVQTMISSGNGDFQAAVVRGVPADAARLDPSLAAHLNVISGTLSLAQNKSIVMGYGLAENLGVQVGDSVSIVSLAGGSFNALRPESLIFTVGGIFKSGYYEFDQSLAFVSLAAASSLGSPSEDLVYGVKLANRFRDLQAMGQIRNAFPGVTMNIESWRTYNSAFFGALRMEKLVMMLLLGLIFVVVGVNIYHFLQRTVIERREEIGILRSLGASPRAMQAVFIFDGLYIGTFGSLVGLLLGLLISAHINEIFAFVELVINVVLVALGALLVPFAGGAALSAFSPAYFYISRIPSQVLFHEALLIFLFGIAAAVVAAFFASRRATEIKPQEVIRYE